MPLLKLDKENYYEAILRPAAKQSECEKWTHEAIKLYNWAELPDTDIVCLARDWVSLLMSLMVGTSLTPTTSPDPSALNARSCTPSAYFGYFHSCFFTVWSQINTVPSLPGAHQCERVDFSAVDKRSDADDSDLFEELERELEGGWVLCANGGWKS